MIPRMPQPEPGDFAKLSELIRHIRIALLTTVDGEGRFHSRPVETLAVEGGQVLWFFTDKDSPKAEELRQDTRVSLGYADPSSSAPTTRMARKTRGLPCCAFRSSARNTGLRPAAHPIFGRRHARL
jgi:hypothetical protein